MADPAQRRPPPDPDDEPARGFEIGTDGPGCVVVGYDGTNPAEDALAFAAGGARRSGTRLVVCTVLTPAALGGLSFGAAGPIARSREEVVDAHRDQVHRTLTHIGVSGEFVRRDGDPARELERLAEELRADHIVVGRSASRRRGVIGSVAVHLVKHAMRSVTVVP